MENNSERYVPVSGEVEVRFYFQHGPFSSLSSSALIFTIIVIIKIILPSHRCNNGQTGQPSHQHHHHYQYVPWQRLTSWETGLKLVQGEARGLLLRSTACCPQEDHRAGRGWAAGRVQVRQLLPGNGCKVPSCGRTSTPWWYWGIYTFWNTDQKYIYDTKRGGDFCPSKRLMVVQI